MRRLALLALLMVPGALLADPTMAPEPLSYTQLADPAQEAKAQALMQTIRCVVCQGQSIADSDAELAGDMRSLVRERIKAGESPQQVRDWLIQRYGSWVSYKPVFGPDTAMLYAAPLLLLAVGGWLAARRLKRRS